jgi:hypothetical protein
MGSKHSSDRTASVDAARDALRAALTDADVDRAIARIAQDFDGSVVLAAVAARDPALSRERLRRLAVELALRSKPIPPDHPVLRRLSRGDPSEPPPWLLPIEQDLPDRAVGYGRAPGSLAWSPPWEVSPEVEGDPLVCAAIGDVTTDADRDALGTAVRAWTRGSNGRVEAKVFVLEDAHGSHVDAALLRSLGLASVPATGSVRVRPTTPEALLGELFAAAHGGAYNPVTVDVHARDLAWASLRALCGADPRERASNVERTARACGITWFGQTPFFAQVAWDLGFAVVSETRDRLAVLAATDTD